jgi:hypothetical protein
MVMDLGRCRRSGWNRDENYNNRKDRGMEYEPESMCMLNRAGSAVRIALCVLMVMSASPATWAQWNNNRGYQLLQRVDDVLFGVDNLSLVILDRRFVAGTLVRVNANQPVPIRGSTEFVADCQKPLRFAARAPDAKVRALPGQLEFSSANLLDGTWFAAEFACESTRQPGRAARLAKDLFERGGPADMQTIYCELQPNGKNETRAGVEVRFSESANAVAVNRQWLSSGEVTASEVRFGSNSKWHINRQALDVRRTAATGEMLFSGSCDTRAPGVPLR